MGNTPGEIALQASDGHTWTLLHRIPEHPRASLLWLPALGVAARHYLPFAEALQARGVAVFLHEARGHGSSNWRASRNSDWGYRELLELDLPVSLQAMHEAKNAPLHIIGGHSLGGQLACCLAALTPSQANAYGWWQAARRTGATLRRRAACCCRWPIASWTGLPDATAPCPAGALASGATKRAD